jgi:16S rRNA (uracil1498-N3)-methyltransferase
VSDRFFRDDLLRPGPVYLEGPEAHHLAAVRRFVVGDIVALFNGDGHEYPALIVEINKKSVSLEITGVVSPQRELGFALHIAAALPKGDRGDFLIEKLTELGVTDFTPLITERSVVRANDARAEKLRRAVIEASKQCGRNVLMRVHPVARWFDWCVKQTGRRFLAHPSGGQSAAKPGEAIVAVGPEGGFTEQEVQVAVDAGWKSLLLGPRVLRVETAAVVVATLLGAQV